MERLTPSQIDAVLMHELCHVRRRDNLAAALHMLVETIFWFHPSSGGLNGSWFRNANGPATKKCSDSAVNLRRMPKA
jgi:Zn-dependent protease with chaperone function